MNIQDNVYARFAVLDQGTDNVTIDFDGLIKRVLLFDTYIIDSIRLKDIPQLVNNFGVNGLIEFLESGVIKIHCDALTTGQTGQTTELLSREKKGVLPLCSYAFSSVNIADREQYISTNLRNVHIYVPELKKAIRLKKAIVSALVDTPNQVMPEAHASTKKAYLEKKTLLGLALQRAVLRHVGLKADLSDMEVNITNIGEAEYKAENNLSSILKVDELVVHKIIEKALLDISGFYQRLSYMKNYEAISWFSEDDLPVLNEEFSIMAKACNSGVKEESLLRVLSIKGLPELDNTSEISVKDLLSVRNSDECAQFREWIKIVDKKTDKEIADAVNSMSERISSVIRSGPGVYARSIVGSCIGLAVTQDPVFGLGVGVGINVLDNFIFDKILKKPGPISFINNSLPRLYER